MKVKEATTRSLELACKHMLQDLEALPEDAFTKSFGTKTRTVADIVYETQMVNDHVGLTIRGEELFDWPDGWIKAPADYQSKQAVIDGFRKSCDKIVQTAKDLDEEGMVKTIKNEDGETTPHERFRFITLHMWYHAGQLNFIQTMLGDDVWHWS